MISSILLKKILNKGKCVKFYVGTKSLSTVVYSWGTGSDGQLGYMEKLQTQTNFTGDVVLQQEPRRMKNSKRFRSISVGGKFSLGISHDRHLFGWGTGFLESVTKPVPEPQPILFEENISLVSAGESHAAALDGSGYVYTWGSNGSWLSGGGQLGHGDRTAASKPKRVEALVDLLQYGGKIAELSCGGNHTVFLTEDGEVLSCGKGEYGRLGTGTTSDCLIPEPIEALAEETVTQISAGYDHTVALTDKGAIYSWGRNHSGQLGHSDSYIDIYSMEDYPRMIDADSFAGAENIAQQETTKTTSEWSLTEDSVDESVATGFIQVEAGHGRSAAVTKDGRLYVWGSRWSHQPKLVRPDQFNNLRVKKVALGGGDRNSIIAVITEDHALWTFGDKSSTMMGRAASGGMNSKEPLPVLVEAMKGKRVLDISCGFGQHMFAFVEVDES